MFHRHQELNIYAIICAGIGAGLESMTVNPMSWDGAVNPKVYSRPRPPPQFLYFLIH